MQLVQGAEQAFSLGKLSGNSSLHTFFATQKQGLTRHDGDDLAQLTRLVGRTPELFYISMYVKRNFQDLSTDE